jgi:TonB-dependent starch-binding outer membrane protein SusC
MKKFRDYCEWNLLGFFSKKTIRVMKLTIFFSLLTIVQLFATESYSQLTKLTLKLENVKISDALKEIENKSEFFFLYSPKLIDVERKVNIDAENEPIKDILFTIFNEKVKFVVYEKQVILTPINFTIAEDEMQQPKITGIVSGRDGAPIPGVNVVVTGTTHGTTTDIAGKYTIEVPKEAKSLTFSFIGMEPQEINIGTLTQINVTLVESAIGLEEVVVIGYGTMSKRNVSGSVSNIAEKDFNKGVNRNAADMLAGKVPGLVITSGTGDVTGNSTIRLRGTSSLTGSSEPFVVVDGIPGIPLNSIAPQDIESVSILKDASATAIYGSRSASGVILVTTKKGKKDKTVVEYEGYVAVDNVSNIPEVLNATEWRDYAQKNSINTEGIDLGANTNWFKEIMRTGITHNHNLSISGGGKNNFYRGSFSYLNKEGVVKDNFMERYNARLLFNQKAFNDKLDLTFIGAFAENNNSPTDTRNFILAYNMIPVVPVKNADGTWFDSQEYDQGNPVRNIEYNKHLNKNNQYYGNIKADLTIVDGLVVGLNLLKQRESNDYGLYNDSQTERGRNDNGYARRESRTTDKKLLEVTLNYKRTLGVHNLNVLGGYSFEDNYYQNLGASNRLFVTNLLGYNDLISGQNLRPSDVWSGANMFRLISFFGRANYIINDRYILMASLRRDGSSKFGKNHKWGTFPSVSVAWRMKEESFMKNMNFLSDLKLRAGYGVSGNQDNLDPYQSIYLYGSSGQYYDNGKWLQSYDVVQNANPNLKWEKTAMFNIGFEYGLFKNRVTGTIDYYDKNTTDLLYTYNVPMPPYYIPTMIANVGAMTNKGIEITINTEVIRKDNFRWNISLNLAHNVNKVTKLSNDDFQLSYIPTGNIFIRGGSSNYTSRVEEGKPVGTFYGMVCKGVDKTTGEFIMDDMVDGVPGLTDADRTYIGSAQPKLTYGLSNTFTYKNWDLNFFLRGVYGNDLFDYSRLAYGSTQWLPGANVIKEAITSGVSANPQISSYIIEKGSFLRLDNASIAYNINTKKLLGIEKLKIYFTGQNLFVITKYKGIDPEVDMSGLAPGVEGNEYYPKSRTFSLGINVGF